LSAVLQRQNRDASKVSPLLKEASACLPPLSSLSLIALGGHGDATRAARITISAHCLTPRVGAGTIFQFPGTTYNLHPAPNVLRGRVGGHSHGETDGNCSGASRDWSKQAAPQKLVCVRA